MTRSFTFVLGGAAFGIILALVTEPDASALSYLMFAGVGAVVGFASIRFPGGTK